MFDRLIASKSGAADRPAVPSGTVSVLVHAGVCAAACSRRSVPTGWPASTARRSWSRGRNHLRAGQTLGTGSTRSPGRWRRRSTCRHNRPSGSRRLTPERPSIPSCCCAESAKRLATTAWAGPRRVRGAPLGRAEPGSLVLQSSHPGFEGAARAYVLGALFRPGRTHGRAVRVLVRLPISFTLRPPR